MGKTAYAWSKGFDNTPDPPKQGNRNRIGGCTKMVGKVPTLVEEERVVLREQSWFSISGRSPWVVGHLYLTTKRLFLFQPYRGSRFEASLEGILDVGIEETESILGHRRPVLYAVCKSAAVGSSTSLMSLVGACSRGGKTLSAWFVLDNPNGWKRTIREAILEVAPLSEENVKSWES